MNIDEASIIIIPIITGITEIFKGLGVKSRYSPVIALILGVLLSVAINGISVETIIIGLIFGLSASGLYSGGKTTIKSHSCTQADQDSQNEDKE